MKPIVDLLIFAALMTSFNHPASHEVINTKNFIEWDATTTNYGGKLYLSDSPEIVNTDGILYKDVVNGEGRVFFHHVNGMSKAKQLSIVFENRSSSTVHIIVSKHGIAGPSSDYLSVGKTAQRNYFKDQSASLIEVPSGKTVSLFPEQVVINPNQLVSGIYDFKISGAVTMKVMMLPVGEDANSFAKLASELPADASHLRGTFPTNNRMITPLQPFNPLLETTYGVTLADNNIDNYVTGIDATDGSSVVNYGNYGIVYQLNMPSSAGSKVKYYINPLGGAYAGALGVLYNNNPISVIDTPSGQTAFGFGTLEDAALIGQYTSGQPLQFTFSPPGSSNLPVHLLLVPQKS